LFAAGTDIVAWLVANPAGLTAEELALAVIGRATEADRKRSAF
jgi:hypothetical protein